MAKRPAAVEHQRAGGPALCFAEPRKVVVGMLRSASGSCYRTKKASFHAVGAPDCPALGHLAAVWWESASRVEQVSCQ
jgi:hypothetical protein